ncbi:hypothetical protein [Dyadobacter sp. CY351]|uniref:hypothetical protein n=1 Tax=Dyadobacter sp. CY351 TaxID=2909337 RepID=UPI001F362EA2|nr:hypothetical protein [Dyadobacter sp. CY351]MCF2517141.1 hypothetical protein [Dyadobacter sp. CY351]
MKKLAFLLIGLCFASVSTFAQTKAVSSFISEYNGTKIDTVVNAGVKNQILKATRGASVLSIQVTATKISGTTAGVVRVFGSNDKQAWIRVQEAAALGAADSLNLANVATQTKLFKEQPSKFLYYRVAVTGSGTQSTKFITTAVGAQ